MLLLLLPASAPADCCRWLFYFLARQKQAEAAIEAYKVVDKQALAVLSPTCLSELFRSLIDNEITTQVRHSRGTRVGEDTYATGRAEAVLST